jgi:hypothetical protein
MGYYYHDACPLPSLSYIFCLDCTLVYPLNYRDATFIFPFFSPCNQLSCHQQNIILRAVFFIGIFEHPWATGVVVQWFNWFKQSE